MINLFSKTHDFTTMINLLSKTHDFIRMMNLLIQSWKGVISEKKYFRWFAVSTCPPGQVLAGPDMSDFQLLVDLCMFGVQFLLSNFLDDSACFSWRS